MKKNYDIRQNPTPLSTNQIARHKDFEGLLKAYESQPVKKPVVRHLFWQAAAVAAAVAGIILLFRFSGQSNFEQRQQAFFASQPFVNQPIPNVKPSFISFKVNPTDGGVYKYPSGSQVEVPAAAFVNEFGEAVSGEVILHYREMHDYVDFFIAGIPMTYDSAGVNYNLESAGMIEIFAEQNGKRVNMAPGKAINVELVSNVNTSPTLEIPTGYNIYKLDESKRSWVYQAIDKMEVLDAAALPVTLDEQSPYYPAQKMLAEKMLAIQVAEAMELTKLENSVPSPKEPTRPQRSSGDEYVFNLDLEDVFPVKKNGTMSNEERELRQLYRNYARMLWQLSPKATITPDRLQKEFSTVNGLNIKKINELDYELTLEKPGESIKVLVNPVLSGSDYDKALSAFNENFKAFQQLKADREAKLAAQKAAIEKKFEDETRLANLDFEQRVSELRKQGLDYAANNEIIKKKVVNRFTASEFGIWNCDRPLTPQVMQLAASFKDENGKSYENRTAYLVDKSRNTVYQFLADSKTQLRFNKNSENLIWLVTDDYKLAVFRPTKFKDIDFTDTNFEFVLESIDKEIKTEQDIRDILYL